MIQIFQRLAFTSLAAFGLVLAAPAATLLSDSFESYATQADFTNSWLILGATPISGTLISTQAVSLPNSVHYDVVRLGSGLTSTREAMFDNVSVVTAVPEPGTLSLIVLGMGGFFLHRRFRRR